MPILKVEIVGEMNPELRATLAQTVADAAVTVLASKIQETWVRVYDIPSGDYAENGGAASGVAPVFVTVLKHHHSEGIALKYEVKVLTEAIARACDRPVENVHLLYEAPAMGRLSFGGKLVE